MIRYIVKRLSVAIPTILLLIIISFFLMHSAPGGPFTSERPLPDAVLKNINEKYGLDKPIYIKSYPSIKNRLLVVQQDGIIKIIENNSILEILLNRSHIFVISVP